FPPLSGELQRSGASARQGDLSDRGRPTNRQSQPLLGADGHQVVREVVIVAVGGLDPDAALAVHGGRVLEGSDQRGASRDRRADNGPQPPHRRVLQDAAVAVLALEVAAAVVLAVSVLAQAKVLVI